MERFSFILVTAGILSFAFAFVVMAVLPWATYKDDPILTVAQLAEEVPYEFYKLARDYPEAFKKNFGEPDSKSFEAALTLGHATYVAEGCWHCHSQQVRPISNEDVRWGDVSYPQEYQNELQMPVMFGTRRIGPDLIRSHGRHGNDWHMAHLYRPRDVVPDSVMPNYPWMFENDRTPGKQALAVTVYLQWLGSWVEGDRAEREAALVKLAAEEAAKAGLVPDASTSATAAEASAGASSAAATSATEAASSDDGWGDEPAATPTIEATPAAETATTKQESSDEAW